MPPTKGLIRDMWQRRRRAYELIDRERRRELARMSVAESLAIGSDLCASILPMSAEERRALDERELRSWLKVRRAFSKWAEASTRARHL